MSRFIEIVLMLVGLLAVANYLSGYLRRRATQHWAEDWSQVRPSPSATLTFGQLRIGQKFTLDRDPNHFVFEKIESTTWGENARCDLYELHLNDDDIVSLVTTPSWNN